MKMLISLTYEDQGNVSISDNDEASEAAYKDNTCSKRFTTLLLSHIF